MGRVVACGSLALLAITLLAGGACAATYVSGTISVDTTWTFLGSPYVVAGSVTVQGTSGADGVTTLTIEPGVEVLFNASTKLTVASSSVVGAIDARGTEDSPILFSSNQATKTRGSWNGITLNNQLRDSQSFLENVTIEYAGSNGNLQLVSAEPTLRNVVFREASTAGLRIENANAVVDASRFENNTLQGVVVPSGGQPTIRGSTFVANGQYGVQATNGIPHLWNNTFLDHPLRAMRVHVESVLSGNAVSNSGIRETELMSNPSALLQKDRTLPRIVDGEENVAYVVADTFTIRGIDGPDGVATLTIEPGVELRFNASRAMVVGGTLSSQPGALDARGSAELPILLTSNQLEKTRGAWTGVTFNDFASDALSVLENVTIEYAGPANANLYLNRAQPAIRDSVFRESSTMGVRFEVAASGTMERSVVANNTLHGVSVPSGGAPTLVENTFLGNGQYGVHVANGAPTFVDNTFEGNGQRPLRTHVDSLIVGSTFRDNGIAEVELHANPGGLLTKDRTFAKLVDETTGARVPWVLTQDTIIRGTDGADAVTTMTITPGAEMRFASEVQLDVGTNTAGQVAALDARGTEEEPILLTSNQAVPTRGWWVGLRIYDQSVDGLTFLENVTIEYAGASGWRDLYVYRALPTLARLTLRESSNQGAYLDDTAVALVDSRIYNNSASGVHTRTGSPTLRGNSFEGNGAYGLYVESGFPAVVDNAFRGNGQRPLRFEIDGAFEGNTFEGDVVPEVEIVAAGGVMNNDQTLPAIPGYTYVMTGIMWVYGASGDDGLTTLTLEPGVEIRFRSATQLVIGGSSSSQRGALVAAGTQESPILLRSDQATPTAGFWRNLYVHNFADDAATRIENVTIRHAGYGSDGALHLERSSPTVRNVLIEDASVHGVVADQSGSTLEGFTIRNTTGTGYAVHLSNFNNATRASVSGLHVENAAGRLLRVHPDAVLSAITADGVAIAEITVVSGTAYRDATWPRVPDAAAGTAIPYVLTNSVYVRGVDGEDGVTTLTIEPGVEVRLINYYTSIVVSDNYQFGALREGAIRAVGTQELPIRFTSHQPEGDKVPGSWGSIVVYDFADDALTAFENVTIEYGGGYFYGGALHLDRVLPRFANNLVQHNDGRGVFLQGSPIVIESSRFVGNGDLISQNGYGVHYQRYYYEYDARAPIGPMVLRDVAFEQQHGRPARIACDAVLDGVSFVGNEIAELEIERCSMRHNTTWGPLADAANGSEVRRVVVGYVQVEGGYRTGNMSVLTILPGTNVGFRSGSLTAGDWGWGGGAIVARGTKEAPILFTSAYPTKTRGDWWGVELTDNHNASATALENVTIEYAYEGLYFYNSSVVAKNLTIRESEWTGAYVAVSGGRLEDTLIERTGEGDGWGYGVYVDPYWNVPDRFELVRVEIRDTEGRPLSMALDTLLEDVVMRNNSVPQLDVSYGFGVRDARWSTHRDADNGTVLPYVLTDYAYAAGTDGDDGVSTLTIDPGVVVRAERWGGLVAGDYWRTTGAIRAVGSPEAPILFTSNDTLARGAWGGIEFSDLADDGASALEHVRVEGAGRWGYGALYLWRAAPTLRDVEVVLSDQYGVYLDDAPARLERVTIRDTAGTYAYGLYAGYGSEGMAIVDSTIAQTLGKPMIVPADAWIEGLTLADNTRPEVDVVGTSVTHPARWEGLRQAGALVPYVVDGDVDVLASLMVAEGAEARFGPARGLYVGDGAGAGALTVGGTKGAPVRFTSSEPEGVRTPAAWVGVHFRGAAASQVDNATIEYGGNGSLGGVRVDASPVTLSNAVLTRNGAYGLHGRDAAGLVVRDSAITRSTLPLFLEDTAGASLERNAISGFGDTAYLQNVTGSTFRGNRFASNDGVFQLLGGSTGNVVLDNNFTRAMGGSPVLDDAGGNTWTASPVNGTNVIGGPMIAGNAYSDYMGLDLTDPSDGIGDTDIPFAIPGAGGASDVFPLVTRDRWQVVTGAPITVARVLGNLSDAGWWTEGARVELAATDLEGDAFVTRYSLDGQPFGTYDAPFPVAGDGAHTVDYYSVDAAGNTESLKRFTFHIDATGPVLAIAVDVADEDVCATIEASDPHSGLARLRWSVLAATGAPAVNRDNVTLDRVVVASGERVCAGLARDGHYTVRAHAEDAAGNPSTLDAAPVTLDVEAPTLVLVNPKPRTLHAGDIEQPLPERPGSPQGMLRAQLREERMLPKERAALATDPALPDAPALEDESIVVVSTQVLAEASDAGSGVALGELYVDGVLVADATLAPFSWTVGPGLAPGYHNLTVRAYDAVGHVAEAHALIYLVAAPPLALPAPEPPALVPPEPEGAPSAPAPQAPELARPRPISRTSLVPEALA